MATIKKEIIETLKTNQKAKLRLAYEFNKHSVTIDRWLEDNNEMLTTKTALAAIGEELKLKENEILA